MIGQIRLKRTIKDLIANNKLPRFIILVGAKGSGKKTVCKYIQHELGPDFQYAQLTDTKVDTIRSMITSAYKTPYNTLYVMPDAESMSPNARNALLKVTEEPPNNAYFIMTVTSESFVLDTIRSRGTVFHIDPYTPEEISEYAKCDNSEDLRIMVNVCEVPGDVDTLKEQGPEKFYSFVSLVVDSIAEVSGANSFKIADRINLKDDPTKYDIRLFWRTFMLICLERIHEEDKLKYAMAVRVTSKYLNDLRVVGINKAQLFDMWILNIREIWL